MICPGTSDLGPLIYSERLNTGGPFIQYYILRTARIGKARESLARRPIRPSRLMPATSAPPFILRSWGPATLQCCITVLLLL